MQKKARGNAIAALLAIIMVFSLFTGIIPHTATAAGNSSIPEWYLKFDGNLANSHVDATPAEADWVGGDPIFTDGAREDTQAINVDFASYVRLDKPDNLIDYSESFSIAFWMKMKSRNGGDPVLMGNKNWSSGGNPGWCLNDNGQIRVNFRSSGGSRGDISIISTANTVEWTHIAVTFDMEANEVKAYANGALTQTDKRDNLLNGNLNGVGPTLLGQAYDSNNGAVLYNNSFSMNTSFSLQDFIMTSGVLSAGEVSDLYGQSKQQDPFVIDGVEIFPADVRMNKGDNMRFVAEPTGDGDFQDGCGDMTWTVEGASSAGTTVADGLLTIGTDETAPVLNVRATSAMDDAYSAAAVVSVTTPRTDGKIAFGVVSDTHVGPGNFTDGNNGRARTAFEFLSQPELQSEFVAVVGDLTGNGIWENELEFFRKIRSTFLDIPLLASMGNHESSQYVNFERATGNVPNYYKVVNGYYFIICSPGAGSLDPATGRPTGNNGSSYSYLRGWVMDVIAEAEAASPNKPIFVFFHHPIYSTHWLSNEQYGSGFEGLFNNHPRVIAFSAHSHGITNHPLAIWQDGGYTTVNTAATCAGEVEQAMRAVGGNAPNGVGNASQGLYVIADDEGSVTIRRRDFANERWLEDWTFNTTQPLPYTRSLRQAEAPVPVFPAEAEIRLTTINMTVVEIEFDQSVVPPNTVGNVPYYYHYQVINRATGATVREFNDWSGFWFPEMPAVLTQEIRGLEKSTDYELRITVVDTYGQAGTGYLSKMFTTTTVDNTPRRPIDYILKFDGDLNNSGSVPDGVTMFNLPDKQGYYDTTPYFTAGKHGQAIDLSKLNFVDLDGASTLIDYEQSFSTAFWINVKTVRNDGEPGILSNRNVDSNDNMGYSFRTRNNNGTNWITLDFHPTSGEFQRLWLAPTAIGEWMHIAATFDYADNKVTAYVNGIMVAEASANLSGGIGGITAAGRNRSTFFGSSPWNYTEEWGGFNGSGTGGRHDIEFLADDFVMSSCVYSAEEILSIMEDPTSRPGHYTVTFDTDGGVPASPVQTVFAGRTAKEPAVPAKEGFTFGGWYNGTDAFDFNAMITADLILTAKWEVPAITCTVTILNFFAGVADIVTVFEGDRIELPTDFSNTIKWGLDWIRPNKDFTGNWLAYVGGVWTPLNGIQDGKLTVTSNITIMPEAVEIQKPVTLISVTPSAYVTKLNGNKNNLTITITERYSDGVTKAIKETFSINNNAAGSYTVGNYRVYVDTKGNDQIRECYIVK